MGFFVDGTSSTDLGALRSGEDLHSRDYSATGRAPPILALSDRGKIFVADPGAVRSGEDFHRWDFS